MMEAGAQRRVTGETASSAMNYSIRRSPSARNVWLRFSQSGDLVVVIPHRFDIRRVADIVEANHKWIHRAATRVGARREAREREAPAALPERIVLPALAREWTLEYNPTDYPHVRIVERDGDRLVLSGNTHNYEQCRDALLRWLRRKGRQTLAPELCDLAARTGFSIAGITVRTQRTRWASCSRNGTISLNTRLLFVPPELVHHVMLHELCHTKRMDHSTKFWSLVESHDPDWRKHRKMLRAGWRSLPAWLDSRITVGRPDEGKRSLNTCEL